jgi:hypothetical protein
MPLDLLERIDCIMTPNTRPELQLEAGARHERTLFPVRSRPLILIDAPSSTSPRGMLGGDKGHSGEEETFYVAVFVKPFLSSFWSAVVLYPLKYFRLPAATCARGARMREASLPQTTFYPCRLLDTDHPILHALLAPGERRDGQPLLKIGPQREPCLLSSCPSQLSLAARPSP